MTDELLFSALGLTMDTNVDRQLLSPIEMNLPNEREVSCATQLGDDFGIFDGQFNMAANPTDCYTDLTLKSSWNDWSVINTPTSSGMHYCRVLTRQR
jgi:hypothetical protein